jgi:hypothetical protein
MMDGMLSISLIYFLFKMWDMKEVWNGAVYMFSGLSLIPGCSPFRETFWVFFLLPRVWAAKSIVDAQARSIELLTRVLNFAWIQSDFL